MSYKRIAAAAHNFAHSFVSLVNYFEDEYVIDIVGKIVPRLPDGNLRIRFPGGTLNPPRTCPAALLASVTHYDAWLPQHLMSECVNPEIVTSVETIIESKSSGLYYRAEATDNRGKQHWMRVVPA